MAGVGWFTTRGGIPMISGAIAHLYCRLHEDSDGGDHAIVIGEVASLDVHPGAPLVYADGSFGALGC
jgi:flavin reductase (DIM6/NTAB) family NADH-FMN oxidoreductase RutF